MISNDERTPLSLPPWTGAERDARPGTLALLGEREVRRLGVELGVSRSERLLRAVANWRTTRTPARIEPPGSGAKQLVIPTLLLNLVVVGGALEVPDHLLFLCERELERLGIQLGVHWFKGLLGQLVEATGPAKTEGTKALAQITNHLLTLLLMLLLIFDNLLLLVLDTARIVARDAALIVGPGLVLISRGGPLAAGFVSGGLRSSGLAATAALPGCTVDQGPYNHPAGTVLLLPTKPKSGMLNGGLVMVAPTPGTALVWLIGARNLMISRDERIPLSRLSCPGIVGT